MYMMNVFDVSTNPSKYDKVNPNITMAMLSFTREIEFKVSSRKSMERELRNLRGLQLLRFLDLSLPAFALIRSP
jgi:hypothetical protein